MLPNQDIDTIRTAILPVEHTAIAGRPAIAIEDESDQSNWK